MRLWLEKAEGDLLVAKLIVNGSLPSYEAASFHAQQAGEKALKALLIRYQIAFTKTHDLGELLRLCEAMAPGISHTLAEAETLNRHAVKSRYPESGAPVSREESTRDLATAGAVVGHVRALVQPYLDAGRPTG